VYTDVEWDVSDRLLLQGALRFEDFSDFGTTTNGKVAARFNVTDSFTLRGAASTGFRAPTPGQSNLETIVLTFDTADGSQALEGTLRPTDSLLRPLGGQALDPEEATNLSIGFTADIGESFTLTGDYYKVDVEDRIVKTFNIDVSGDPSFANSEFDLVAFYTNGLETETEGFDIIAIYYVDWADSATTFSLAWNHNKTEVTKQNSVLAGGVPVNPVSAGTVFNIQNNLPEDRFSFTANHTMERITLTLRANWYDETIDERNDREKVDSGMVVDIEGRYMVTDNLTVVLGANNVLDEFPNKISTRRSQGLEYPRRTPIGYDGAMWYLKGVWEF
jgi:iron complex outermembrane receptor protein